MPDQPPTGPTCVVYAVEATSGPGWTRRVCRPTRELAEEYATNQLGDRVLRYEPCTHLPARKRER